MATIHPALTRLGAAAILAISAAPLYAQAQQPSADTLKAEARNFLKIISGDKRKSQTYREIVELNDQIDQEEDPIEVQELSQKRDKLEEKLGRKYVALVAGTMSIDKDSRDYQEIASILEPLDKLCRKFAAADALGRPLSAKLRHQSRRSPRHAQAEPSLCSRRH